MEEATTIIEPIDKIAAALAKAQGKMTNPPKNKQGQCRGGRYMYADLADVLDHVRGPLTENGLSVVQIVKADNLITRLVHSSGQFFESVYPLPKHGSLSAQDMGSAITYARRYSLCPLLGIAGETDDDAKGAADAQEERKEAEEAQAREEARKRIEERKAAGKMTNAHTGEPIKPGEKVGPTGETVKTAQEDHPVKPNPPSRGEPAKGPSQYAGINPQLAQLMASEGIKPEELQDCSVALGHFPAPGMVPAKFPPDYVALLTKRENWEKIVQHIKKGKTK